MGKDLKGKELGVGISQLPNKKYIGRFTTQSGKRIKKEFNKLQECRKWIADAQFDDEHGNALKSKYPTVDAWYDYWINEIKGNNVKASTLEIYKMRYNTHIKNYIGSMLLSDVKPMHCQNILNKMAKEHRASMVKLVKGTLGDIFECAYENDLIEKNPISRKVKISGKKSKDKRVLTIDEQRDFLKGIKYREDYYNQFAFVLQTGLRVGEMIGLKWSDVDFENRLLHVKRTMYFRNKDKTWHTTSPKTESGTRDIPLTQEAIAILKDQQQRNRQLKVTSMEFANIVFLNKKGLPMHNNSYDYILKDFCLRNNVLRFSMHTLRHTFATRCIEAGMKPKTLQMILGHSAIEMTMNLYVHITKEEKVKEIESVEKMLMIK